MEIDVALDTYYRLAEDRQTPMRCSLLEWGRMMKKRKINLDDA